MIAGSWIGSGVFSVKYARSSLPLEAAASLRKLIMPALPRGTDIVGVNCRFLQGPNPDRLATAALPPR